MERIERWWTAMRIRTRLWLLRREAGRIERQIEHNLEGSKSLIALKNWNKV